MWHRPFLIAICLQTALPAQPTITYLVDAAAKAGVFVLTAVDARFDAALDSFLQNPRTRLPRVSDIKPYMLIVENNSPDMITRLTVRHELSYPARPSIVWNQTLVQPGEAPVLQPRGKILAFQGVRYVAPGAPGASQKEVDDLVSWLATATEVTVSLDSVIFDSGLLLGPDKSGGAARYQAEQRGVRDMLAELQRLRRRGSSTPDEYLRPLTMLKPRLSVPLPDAARDDIFNYQSMQSAVAGFLVARGLDVNGCIAYLASVNANMKELHR